MKSAHRHQLETNVLAHRLEVYIERYRPYASRVVGVIIAVVVLIFLWSYISGSSAAKRSEAWDTYNHAVSSVPPSLEEIHRTAQDYPGTPMQQMADVTWADGQVLWAAEHYLDNRRPAMDALGRATSVYQSVIQSSNDERLNGRARLGLARIYEMQNHLDKAREQYRQVTGAYSKYADRQAERLEKPSAQETYAWLATAELPRPKMPVGPGTPGQRPEFSPGEMALPSAAGADAGKVDDAKGAAAAFEDLLKGMKDDSKNPTTPERYKTDQPAPNESNTKATSKDANPGDAKANAVPLETGATGSKPAESPPTTDKPAK